MFQPLKEGEGVDDFSSGHRAPRRPDSLERAGARAGAPHSTSATGASARPAAGKNKHSGPRGGDGVRSTEHGVAGEGTHASESEAVRPGRSGVN